MASEEQRRRSEREVYGAAEEQQRHLTTYSLDWAEMHGDMNTEADWLLEPVLARGRAHALFAPAKAGKSLLALYLAAAVASGKPCLNKPATEPVPVLYIDYEMTKADVFSRADDYGYEPEELAQLHYVLQPPIPRLDTRDGGEQVAEWVKEVSAQLVVIDTTGRSVSGSENDADTYISFSHSTGEILKRLGVTWLRLDHAGKDYTKGQRGSSAKNDDVDVVWSLVPRESDNGSRPYWLQATHQRMNWLPSMVDLALISSEDAATYWSTSLTSSGLSYPAGTAALIADMDRLGIDPEATQRDTRAVLKAAGVTAKGTKLAAAMRARRERAEAAELLKDDDGEPF